MDKKLTETEAIKLVHDSTFIFHINMNGTFYYASADGAEIDGGDMIDLLPIIQKYGDDAMVAYEAIKRGHDPQIPQRVTKEFKAAKKEIKKIIANAEEYGDFYELRSGLKNDGKT